MFNVLDKNNFLLYAMKMYDNPSCTNIDEFHEDLKRIKYVKRLLGKFEAKGLLRERLILNHIIILGNVFGMEASSRILFYKIEEKYHSSLKTFLYYLQYLPPIIIDIDINKIPLDHRILKALEEL